jgi:predicted permease
VNLSGTDQDERVTAGLASGNYFSVLGVTPALGRGFLPEEDQSPGANPVVVVSYYLWRDRFASDRDFIGKPIRINGNVFTVVGVAPEGFNGTMLAPAIDLWVPLMMQTQLTKLDRLNARNSTWLNLTGRLKPNVGIERAQESLRAIARQIEQTYPTTNEGMSVMLTPAKLADPELRTTLTTFMGVLFIVVGLVLLIACANVGNMLLARATARQREISVRLAMGATRRRLVRQLLTENIILSLLGGALGMLLAVWSIGFLLKFKPPVNFRIALDFSPDYRVLLFALLISLLTTVIFGLAPALQASKPDLVQMLKEDSSTFVYGKRKIRLRSFLVVAQITLSLILLVVAGLFIRSLRNASSIDPGFNPQTVMVLPVDLENLSYKPSNGQNFFRQLIERVEPLSNVESVSLMNNIQLGFGSQSMTVFVDSTEHREVDFNVVSPNSFETLRVPILRGRDFSSLDTAESSRVAIINETLANRIWPGQDPLGRQIRVGKGGPLVEIVGVAKTGKYRSLGEDPRPYVYLPLTQNYRGRMSLLVRTRNDAGEIASVVRREIRAIDDKVPLHDVKSMSQHLELTLLPARLAGNLLGVFGFFALGLAAVGLYGVTAYSVHQRAHEMGIRMALGAQPLDILKMVIGRSLKLSFLGILGGLIVSFIFTRIISGLLYGLSATDPIAFFTAALVLLGATVIASYIPARRASRFDPAITLRQQ